MQMFLSITLFCIGAGVFGFSIGYITFEHRSKSQLLSWELVELLRAPEGAEVSLFCDNPDFNGQPNCAVEVCDDWTGWKPQRFTGDTVLEALRVAYNTRLEA